MTEVLPRGTRAILDWPVAFVVPLPHPRAAPARHRGPRAVARRPARRRPLGRDHLHARARRAVRRAAAAGHAAAHAHLPARRPDPRRRPALPVGAGDAAAYAGADRPRPRRGTGRTPATCAYPVDREQLIENADGVVGSSGRPGCPRMASGTPNLDDPDRRTAAPHGSTPAPHRDRRARPAVAPAVPDEHPAPSRLVVQRGLFFGPSALVPEDLYSVVSRGGRAPRAAPGRPRPAQRRRHQHLLGPLPRHLLAALDRGRRGRGDRAGQRHRPGAR